MKKGLICIFLLAVFMLLFTLNYANAATRSCWSCGNCTAEINVSSAGDIIQLNTSVVNQVGDCIISNAKKNFTFDCQNNSIQGDNSGTDSGIVINETSIQNSNVTVRNCNISRFDSGVYLYKSSNNTLTSITVNSNGYGISLSSSSNNTLTGITINSNSYYGIYLSSSSNNILTGITANSNQYGIYFSSSSNNNILTGITVNSSSQYGISLYSSLNNILTNITANNNSQSGIVLSSSSNNNTFTNNTANFNSQYGILLDSSSNNTFTNNTANFNSQYGISLSSSSNNIFTNNTVQENDNHDIYILGAFSYCNNTFTNTNGSGGRAIEYYSNKSTIENKTLSQLILCNADNSVVRNITIQGSDTKNNSMLYLLNTDNVSISNINSSQNRLGISLTSSSNNTLTNITANSNSDSGISLSSSSNNTLTGITVNSNSYYGISLSSSFNNTLTGITVNSNSYYGIYLYSGCSNNILTGITANSNSQYGIYLYSNSNNTLTNITANSNSYYGILLSSSSNNTLTSITANFNSQRGISLSSSSNNTLTNITTNNNSRYGILLSSSSNNIFTNNTANFNSQYGIYLSSSSNNIFTNNTVQENNYYDIYILGAFSYCNNTFTNTNGSGGRAIEYYSNTSTIENKTLSQLILCNADNSVVRNITIQGSDIKNNMLYLLNTDNVSISNINSSQNRLGISLTSSLNNTLTDITANFNSQYGIYLGSSSNYNIINKSHFENNLLYGFYINSSSKNNSIYNNFFNNSVNYYNASAGLTNFFNTTKTPGTSVVNGSYIGGNFWATPTGTGFSETCTADSDSDKICDTAYNLDGLNYDYLPLFLTLYYSSTPENETGGTTGGTGSGAPPANQTITPTNPAEILINNSKLDLIKLIVEVLEAVSGASFTVAETHIPNINEQIGVSGTLYQAFNITAKGITNDKIKNVTLEFKVNKTWLFHNNGTSSDIRLHRKQNLSSRWEVLPTNLKNQDNSYYYFSALSPGFSTFVIFYGKYECQPGANRCYDEQSQLCLGNSTWLITEKCRFGCENGKCIKTAPQSIIVYTLVIAIVSVAIILTSYLILAKVLKKKRR